MNVATRKSHMKNLFRTMAAAMAMKPIHKVGILAIAALTVSSARASTTEFTFTNRANVNLLNSWEVSISAPFVATANGYNASQLRGSVDGAEGQSGIAWFSGYFADTTNEVFTINLGQTRNLKTIRTDGFSNINGAIIETSPDGSVWTTQTHGVVSSGNERMFTLDSAINAQYLRITGTNYVYETGGERRVALEDLRVYGDVGTLAADRGLDLVSRSAGGAITFSQSGGGYVSGSFLDQSDDNPSSFPGRQLLYDMGSGDSVKITFPQLLELERFGFKASSAISAALFDTNMHFQVYGSTDGGTTFPTLLLDQSGGLTTDLNFFGLPNLAVNALRFDIVSSTKTDNRFTDFFAFIPEPSTALLFGLGGLLFLRRRR